MDEPGYKPRVAAAAKRHNDVLKLHAGFPMSTGSTLYVICQCQRFKGTFHGHEEHCQRMVIDAAVLHQ